MHAAKMIWGYAGVFPGEFRLWDGDPLRNKYRFMADHGFDCTGLGLKALAEPGAREFLREHLAAHPRFVHSLGFHAPFFTEPVPALLERVERYLGTLAGVKDELRVALVTVGVGPYHRFMRDPSLAFQLERLRTVLTPLAAGLAKLGLRAGIENHCDYYVTDLIGLCREVPGLGIFWDTGNTSMTGENPVAVAREAAPFVVGAHFKDFFCRPDEKELKLVVTGAALGDGDIGLERIHAELAAHAPGPLVMEFELIPDPALGAWQSLERSKRFVERIAGHRFLYPALSAVATK